jgi:hypothetical protein
MSLTPVGTMFDRFRLEASLVLDQNLVRDVVSLSKALGPRLTAHNFSLCDQTQFVRSLYTWQFNYATLQLHGLPDVRRDVLQCFTTDLSLITTDRVQQVCREGLDFIDVRLNWHVNWHVRGELAGNIYTLYRRVYASLLYLQWVQAKL